MTLKLTTEDEKAYLTARGFLLIVVFFFGLLIIFHPGTSMADQHPVQSASEADYPPFCVRGDRDTADGFSVELLKAALNAMGREVTFKVGPWSEVKQSLVDGRVRVLPLVGRTPEREKVFDFTFPYMTMHGTIVVRSGTNNIRNLDDLVGKKVAVMQGDNAEEFLLRSKLDLTLFSTKTFDEALQNLSRGDYDAVVIQKLVATQIINKHGMTDLTTAGPPLEEFSQVFCFAVTKGDSQLLSILNEGLSIVIADGTFAALRKKWFADLESPPKSRITVGGDYNYPPFEYLDKNDQPTGYNVDLTRAIAKHLGLAVDIQLGPWSEVRRKLEHGEIEMVQGMYYSAERDRALGFTDAHTLVSHVVVSRVGNEPLTTMADLAGKIIIVMDGDIMHDLAVKAGYEKQLILAKTQEEALHMLSSGDYDYALLAKVPALYWIERDGLNNLQVGNSPLISSEYCYASNHGNQNLIERFSQGLVDLKADGTYREIHQQWLGSYEQQGVDRDTIIRYTLFTLIPIAALFILSILWTKALQKKVRVRTAELEKQISERKHFEEQLAEQAEKLKASQSMLIQQEKLAAIGQLAAGVAHEINNPLGYISSNLNSLGKYSEKIGEYFKAQDATFADLPPEKHQAAGEIRKKFKIDLLLEDLPDLIAEAFEGADKIKKIVLGMKTFSRKDGETPSPVDINECLESAITIVWNEIKYNAELVKDLGEVPPIIGYQQQLAQVFMNLLVNASHAIAEKGQIQLKSWHERDRVLVSVNDNGSGIAKMNLTKIFDPFFTTKAPGKGTGLGMSIAREIVEKHGGTIGVESELGAGTTFTVSLPINLKA